VKPPSKDVLFERLRNRKTETPESLAKRINRAGEELTFENRFNKVIVNDNLENAFRDADEIVGSFLKQ
jgi:guanylate kinase